MVFSYLGINKVLTTPTMDSRETVDRHWVGLRKIDVICIWRGTGLFDVPVLPFRLYGMGS